MPIHDWRGVGDDVFHDFHLSWIAELRGVLNRRILPPGYYARAEDHALGGHAAGDGGGGRPMPSGAISVAASPPRTRIVATVPRPVVPPLARTLAIRSIDDSGIAALIEIIPRCDGDQGRRCLNALLLKLVGVLRGGIHLLLIDLQPPTSRDPEGIHAALWEALGQEPPASIPGRPLTLASYAADRPVRAYIEPTAVGTSMPEMPLFLEPEWYVSVPLEETYREAFTGVPREFRRILEATI